jgi:hypothetical protein
MVFWFIFFIFFFVCSICPGQQAGLVKKDPLSAAKDE